MKKRIILVGYRATGKTTLAVKLGKILGWPSLDTDPLIEEVAGEAEISQDLIQARISKVELIEKKAGKSITQIFAENGEAYFRELEAQVVVEVLRETAPLVLATGGGVPLRADSRKLLRNSGVVFWLQACPKTIYSRINKDKTSGSRRPALTDLGPIQEIEELLKKRDSAYRSTAHYILDTENLSLDQLCDRVLALYKEKELEENQK
ncbi:MAG: shikimate kinase [Planctomycetia bacterium]|nr:shikimate kinase [Planctomycetia bacterium]